MGPLPGAGSLVWFGWRVAGRPERFLAARGGITGFAFGYGPTATPAGRFSPETRVVGVPPVRGAASIVPSLMLAQ